MRIALFVLVLVTAAMPLRAVEVGDTYEQVIAEKGQPVTRLQAGEMLVLNYREQQIKLKANKVVQVNSSLSTVPPAPAPKEAPGSWTTNYPGALAQAHKQDAKVFLYFTGSDWNGWCKRLDREILSTDQFMAYARQNLILVKIDFPRGIPQAEALKAQNAQLARQYKVTGFPTIIVLDRMGKQVGALGFQEGGPGPFVEAIDKF